MKPKEADYKVIITGSTGMVGEGVLLECMNDPRISAILCISRKSNQYNHPKLREYIVPDFTKLDFNDSNFYNYDGCFYCAGVSSVGKNEFEFSTLTYNPVVHFAKIFNVQNPNATFIYVSGKGTDTSERGKVMWSRIKGKTENELIKMGFNQIYNFRPGFMKHTKGQKFELAGYRYIGWMYPFLKIVFPKFVCTLAQVGQAMINCMIHGYQKNILEVEEIKVMCINKKLT